MAKTSTSNGHGLPEQWEKWPTMLDVTRELDVHHSVVRRLVSDGLLKQLSETPDGVPRYSPSDVQSLKGYVQDMPETERRPVRTPIGGITHEEFKGATDLVRQVHKHHETMIPLLVDAWKGVVEAGRLQNERDAKRIAELEAARDQGIKAREDSLSQATERAIAQEAFKAAEARKTRAFNSLVENAGPAIMKKLGLESDPAMGTALALLKTFKRDQLLMLTQLDGFISEEQKTLLQKLIGQMTPEEKAALEGQTKEESK